MKKAIIILLMLLSVQTVFSQDSRIFHAIKISLWSELLIAPTGVVDYNVEYVYSGSQREEVITYSYGNLYSLTIFSFIYSFRYNIVQPTENFSIGLNVSPNFGLNLDREEGLGSINNPGYISFNFGAGATDDGFGGFGGYIGIGYEYTKINLIPYGVASDVDKPGTPLIEPITSWSEPMLIGGVRWRTRFDMIVDFSIKYGFGTNKDLPIGVPKSDISKPQTFQISIGIYI